MKLVEARRHISLAIEVSRAFPHMQFLSDQQEAADFAMGVWEDNGYYLFAMSHFDTRPEELTMVLTAKEWRAHKQGRLQNDPQAMMARIRRAERMYPHLVPKL